MKATVLATAGAVQPDLRPVRTIFYHADCVDGTACAAIASMYFAKTNPELYREEYWPVKYGEPVPTLSHLRGADVYILDFSFDLADLEFILDVAKSVTWIDHHETGHKKAQLLMDKRGTLRGMVPPVNDACGALLCWKYWFPGVPIPPALALIDDYDRWQFKLHGTKAFNAYLRSYPLEFNSPLWQKMLSPEFDYSELVPPLSAGEAILRYKEQLIASCLQGTVEPCNIAGQVGLCANLPGAFASDAGHILANQSGTFGATYFKCTDGSVKWSLRSTSDYNVAELAELFGGGGHKNAAGFVIRNPMQQQPQVGSGITLFAIVDAASPASPEVPDVSGT